jgi:uncharacterized protein YaaQ
LLKVTTLYEKQVVLLTPEIIKGGINMKLIIAIVHDEDAGVIIDEFSENKLQITKLCTTGGFIKSGNTTLISGVEDYEVEKAVDIISRNTQVRLEAVKGHSHKAMTPKLNEIKNGRISVGAATIFITNIERFEKF